MGTVASTTREKCGASGLTSVLSDLYDTDT